MQFILRKYRSSRGVSFLEFAIVAPVMCLVVLGIIDLFSYLYLKNILEARAHRALEVASWVPHLSEPQTGPYGENGSNSNNADFSEARQKIISAALEGEVSTLFSASGQNSGRAQFLSANDTILEKYIDYSSQQNSDIFAEAAQSRVGIVLPQIDLSNGNRDAGFTRQPIGIVINARLNPITPFVPSIIIKGIAWGFREDYSSSGKVPMFDCLGKPFNPNNLPTPEECECGNQGVNPNTGQCGCPAGKIWGIRPGSTTEECICDISLLGCSDGRLIDYDNCKCGNYCTNGANALMGQRRTEDNTCGCPVIPGAVIEGNGCKKNVCTIEDGQEVCKDDTSACSNANCYSRTHWSESYCGCWCNEKNALIGLSPEQPGDGSTLYQYYKQDGTYGSTYTDPALSCPENACNQTGVPAGWQRVPPNCVCVSQNDPPDPQVNSNGFIIQKQVTQSCLYECKGSAFPGRHEINAQGQCVCKSGYVAAPNIYNGNEPTDCCSANLCTHPHEHAYIGNNSSGQRACLCKCDSGFTRDANTNECLPIEGQGGEGVGG